MTKPNTVNTIYPQIADEKEFLARAKASLPIKTENDLMIILEMYRNTLIITQ